MNPDLVRIKNVGDKPWTDQFGRVYTLQPGETGLVSWAAMCCWLGDPMLLNKEFNRERDREYERLRVRHGAASLTEEEWEAKKPTLLAKTVDGEDIWTVLADPEGKHATEAGSTVEEKEVLESQLEAMRKTQSQLQAQLNQLLVAQGAGEEVPEDEPKAVAVGERRGRER